MHRPHGIALLLALGIVAAVRSGTFGEDVKPPAYVKPTANSAEEPLAKEFSFAKSAEFLDNAAVTWTRERKCGTCHTNYPYLMARPLLKEAPMPGHAEVRRFFEDRIAGWDTKEGKPRWDTEVVATAAVLAINDAQTTGKLHPLTRQALDRMWKVQKEDGAWKWLKCRWPPFEHDDYYGAALAALGVSVAPDGYAQAESAKAGLAKLRDYFKKAPAPDLHHKTWLLWASLKLDGLLTKEEREATLKELRALQRADGGWSLASLGDWKGHDKRENDKNAPSDGYATGLVVYVLRQAGTPAKEEPIQRGVSWLKKNQRESGRWFTRSLNSDRFHYITNAGTSFAVLALKACE